jgi:hypothetical protein
MVFGLGDGRRLERRVLERCGSGDRFAALGFRFDRWAELGPQASLTIRQEVEPLLEQHLATAEHLGRKQGRVVGLVLGLMIGTVMLAGAAAAVLL